MSANLKIWVDGGVELLKKLGDEIHSGYLSTPKSIEARVFKIKNSLSSVQAVNFSDDDFIKLMAITQLQREAVRSKFVKLRGVPPDSVLWNLALISAFGQKNIVKETKHLFVKRAKLLEALKSWNEGVKRIAMLFVGTKGASNPSPGEILVNTLAAKDVMAQCDNNIKLYQMMINQRKEMIAKIEAAEKSSADR